MSSNSFHDLIDLDVVHYPFELARRVTTVSDKVHATELSHFIKLFSYPIQNRDIRCVCINIRCKRKFKRVSVVNKIFKTL